MPLDPTHSRRVLGEPISAFPSEMNRILTSTELAALFKAKMQAQRKMGALKGLVTQKAADRCALHATCGESEQNLQIDRLKSSSL
eukprot:IDg12334t1